MVSTHKFAIKLHLKFLITLIFLLGQPVQVNYVADEFGYQPTGPGVHPDIVRAVQAQVAEARANPQPPLGFDNSGFGRFG